MDQRLKQKSYKTYSKKYGWVNLDNKPPLLQAGGKNWITHKNKIAVFPDEFAEEGIENGMAFEPLPSGLEVITQQGVILQT